MKGNLIFDRKRKNMGPDSVKETQSEADPSYQAIAKYSAFLGVINILDQSFLLMVDDVTAVCEMNGHKIFKIENTSLIPYENLRNLNKSANLKELQSYAYSLRKVPTLPLHHKPSSSPIHNPS